MPTVITDPQIIATTIRMYAARNGRTIQDIADALGTHRQSIHQRLAGKASWKLTEIEAIAEVLDCTMLDLITDPFDVGNRRDEQQQDSSTWRNANAAWTHGPPRVAA